MLWSERGFGKEKDRKRLHLRNTHRQEEQSSCLARDDKASRLRPPRVFSQLLQSRLGCLLLLGLWGQQTTCSVSSGALPHPEALGTQNGRVRAKAYRKEHSEIISFLLPLYLAKPAPFSSAGLCVLPTWLPSPVFCMPVSVGTCELGVRRASLLSQKSDFNIKFESNNRALAGWTGISSRSTRSEH